MEELSETGLSSALKAVDDALPILQQSPSDSALTLAGVAVELSHSVKNEEGLKIVVEHIFQECLRRSDVHVAAAQLCAYLSANLELDDAIKATFRKMFLSRCQSMYVARNEMAESYTRRKQLIIFTEFMAQVLIHMRLPNGLVMDPFPEVVIKLLTAVLQVVSEESIHCVDRVLQLTGSLLDQNEIQRPAFDALFISIRDMYLETVFKQAERVLEKLPGPPRSDESAYDPEQQKILLRLILLKSLKWIPNDFLNDM